MANVIEQVNRPTLVLAHNKTLAAQLYAEFKEFFPHNAVEYFVSYYDYYQPEAYVPRTDTYIEKDADINEEIDKLRHAATRALLTRRDVIIVASVSCIYGLGSPEEYAQTVVSLRRGGASAARQDRAPSDRHPVRPQRHDARARHVPRPRRHARDLSRLRGDRGRVEFFGDEIERIVEVDPLTGELLVERLEVDIYPAKHFVTTEDKLRAAIRDIEPELEERSKSWRPRASCSRPRGFASAHDVRPGDARRKPATAPGVENYSMHLSRRKPGEQPSRCSDYFPDDFLLFIDESHISIPAGARHVRRRPLAQGRAGRARLPPALGARQPAPDLRRVRAHDPAGHLRLGHARSLRAGAQRAGRRAGDPPDRPDRSRHLGAADAGARSTTFLARSTPRRQGQRALVTTLTKRMAEDLADYFKEMGVRTHYLHSEIDTLERVEILRDLRLGVYDVVVGINLLREGLDLPEVSLVAILDADKEGFLRSEGSLIQTIGRAARHVDGQVIMYADTMTRSMNAAIDETYRRRAMQIAHNERNGIVPRGIVKEIKDITDRVRAVAEEQASYATGGKPGIITEIRATNCSAWSRSSRAR